jgi:uncharacterized protein YcfJ
MTAAHRILPLLLLVAAGPALGQYGQDPYDQDPAYYEAPVPENISYGYAQVLRADEVFETVRTRVPEERCSDTEYRQSGRTTGGTVIGAIVGAALGNQVGKGDGRKAATVAGAVAGGVVGHNIAQRRAEAEARGCTLVEVEREERQVVGYDVEYMYKGEKYMSRLPYDPGNRLRIRVSVTPDDGGAGSR